MNEAKTILCGDKGGADMLGKDGGSAHQRRALLQDLYVTEPDLKAGGAAFYDGTTGGDAGGAGSPRVDRLTCWTTPSR